MKTALICTTVNVPTVLSLYRAHDPDVRFFVAMDKKTPKAAYDFLESFTNCDYRDPACDSVYWKCSELIGWNTISRRNIALLEALKWGADLVITIDDDNLPLAPHYFSDFIDRLDPDWTFNGLQATSPSNWFDVGQLLDPIAPHRGFPHVKRAQASYAPITAARVGVAAGICLGDPDIDATTRIARAPMVHRVSEILRAGVVVDPARTWTVFNSQNTAIIREIAPAFFMVPQWGRYDDIFASLMVQRLMRERGLVTHFGQPFVWQQRNAHDLLRDLRAEQFGAERILDFTDWLENFSLKADQRVTDQMRILFTNLPGWMPQAGKIQEMVLAWCDDVESVQ